MARLDGADHRAYEEAVARVLPQIEASLLPGVVANRTSVSTPGGDIGPVRLEYWGRARARYRLRLQGALARPGVAVFLGDVRACYGSITPLQVERALRRAGSRPGDPEQVGRVLRDLADRGVPGLPVGPSPSAPLANLVLSRVDRALSRDAIAWARWVDDVVVVTDSVVVARRMHDAFRRELNAIGLEANQGKTMVLADPLEASNRLPGPGGKLSGYARAMMRPL